MSYDGSGRLTTVARAHLDGSGTETTTVLYKVPLAADAANPANRPDMTTGTVGSWGQTDTPDGNSGATAVCPPGSTVTTSGGDLRDCTVSYLDANGRAVNTASYAGSGAAGWHITTTEYDALGHVVRSLTAADREEALNPTSGAGATLGLPTDTAQAALELSTINTYTQNLQDGLADLTATFGPYHQVELPDGTKADARAYTSSSYDDSVGDPLAVNGNEPGHPAGLSYHLVVETEQAASLSSSTNPTSLTDERTTDTHYYLGSDSTGWTYRAPMQTVTDPNGLAITNTTLYDPATGRVTQTRMPSAVGDSTGATAGTTKTIYYKAGTGSGDSGCDNHPLWDGLVCKTLPGLLTPTGGLPGLVTTWVKSYDYLGRATETEEISGADTAGARVTKTTYGFNSTAGAPNPYASTVQTTAVTGGIGAAVPAQTSSYDTGTGLVTGVSNGSISDATSYDDFGRVTGYTEDTGATGAAANTATTSYDATHGWVSSRTDAHTTVSYTYNENGEHRGLLTGEAITVAPAARSAKTFTGSYTGGYDADGDLATQTDPNGVTTALTRDETGQLTSLVDTRSGAAWLSDTETPSVHGQWRHHAGPAGTQDYSYDAAGRLTQATDTPAASTCQTRVYGYDADSNRRSLTSYPADANGCQSTTGGSTVNHSYDDADRLQPAGTDAGVGYDSFGRTTTVPASDVTGGATVTVGYYTNDLVHSQTQAGTVQTWSLDAEQRLGGWTTTVNGSTTATKTNHYDDASSDAPAWIAETSDSTQWTANLNDLTGSLGVTANQDSKSLTATLNYPDLHGDVAATAVAGATSPTINPDYGEFGTNPATTNPRYGWLGAKQRSSDDQAGLILMGVRLYNPTLGRFLQTDPIPGGSANAYAYVNQDPVDNFDLDGRMCWWHCITHHINRAWHHSWVSIKHDVLQPAHRAAAVFWHYSHGCLVTGAEAGVAAGVLSEGAAALPAAAVGCAFGIADQYSRGYRRRTYRITHHLWDWWGTFGRFAQ